MSIQALRERLAALNNEANKLLAEKGAQVWSKEDQNKFDGLMDEAERAQSQIERTQAQLDKTRDENFADATRVVKDAAPRDAKAAEDKATFDIWLRKSFNQMNAEEIQRIRNTMSTTTGSQGGYSMQSNVAAELIDLLKAYAYMRQAASQMTTAQGNPLSYPTSDGTSETGEWIAQNTTATAADPTFGTVALNVFKASSKIVAVPLELLQDSQIDISGMVLKRLADRIGRISNTGYTTGAGSTDPNGMVSAAGTGKTGANGQTLTIIYDDLVDMIDSLDAAYLGNSGTPHDAATAGIGWMFSQTMRKVVRKIKDGSNRPLWTPSYDAGIAGGFTDQLMGYPVFLNNDMAVPAVSAKSLAFGNFKRYMIRDAMDVTVFRFDDSAYMKLGQVGFLAWARTGGNLLDVNAVKLYVHSAT